MIAPKTIEFILKIIFFVVSTAYLSAVFIGADSLKPYLISLPIITLGFLYLLKVKKKSSLVLIALFFTVIGSVFSVFESFYLLAVVLFFIEHILFISLINGYLKLKSRRLIPLYMFLFLVFFILLFLIIYGGTEKDMGYYIVFVYGFTSFSLTALAFTNFLFKMNKANFLLLLGFFIGIASDSIYSINLLDGENSYFIFLAEFSYWFSYYAIYTGFTKKSEQKNYK